MRSKDSNQGEAMTIYALHEPYADMAVGLFATVASAYAYAQKMVADTRLRLVVDPFERYCLYKGDEPWFWVYPRTIKANVNTADAQMWKAETRP